MTLSEAIKQEARGLGFDAVGISRVDGSQRFDGSTSSPSRGKSRDRLTVPTSANSVVRPRGSRRVEPSLVEPSTPLRLDPEGDRGVEGPSAISSQPTPLPPYPVTPLSRLLFNRLMEWLQRGYHGTMDWMARDPSRRADPQQVLSGCRSVISLGMNYYQPHRADERPGYGRIARYAWGEDYHEVLKQRLEKLEGRIRTLAPGTETRWYVDTGPVMEKAWAQQAGLGWVGKHSNLVSPRYGSWLLLGEILTTIDLDPDEPGTDLCGSCMLCIRACPTGAITEPYVVDARKCISYLTIELHRPGDEIPAELTPKLGNRIFGCDDCLDVCPYNINASSTTEQAFHPSPLTLAPHLTELSELSERTFTATFRRGPIRRAKYQGLLRNVRIAIQNLRRVSC